MPCGCKAQTTPCRSSKLLGGKQSHRTHVADEVDNGDEETHVSPDAETSDEAIEENRLKSQIGNVEAQALHKQPHYRLPIQCLIIQRHVCHDQTTGNDQSHQAHQSPNIAAEEDESGKYPEDDQRNNRIHLGEKAKKTDCSYPGY